MDEQTKAAIEKIVKQAAPFTARAISILTHKHTTNIFALDIL